MESIYMFMFPNFSVINQLGMVTFSKGSHIFHTTSICILCVWSLLAFAMLNELFSVMLLPF